VDGIIDDPRKPQFDPATIQCAAGDNPSCLTATQVSQVRKIYAGLRDPTTGAQIWPPYMIGSEDQWTGHISQNNDPPSMRPRASGARAPTGTINERMDIADATRCNRIDDRVHVGVS
jgi:hypothetical protein